jgi:hypothetical protein
MIQTVVHFARSLAQLHRMPASRRNLVTRLFAILGIILVPGILLLLWQPSAWALDIGPLLDTCPQRDPAYFQIRSDFEIRRNGVPVQEILCSEPISQLPISQYTDELIVVQGLRAVFYMDLGSTPLPWAPGMTLYDWMKSKSAGINISDTAGNSSCCEILDGELFVTLKAQDDSNRDFDRGWRGISGYIDLYAHELRHLDGFPHVSSCGILDGCDQTYDETNLSPYGIQWWLNAHWLTGDLYVGFSCLAPTDIDEIADWHMQTANNIFRNRFGDNQPPLLMRPPMPGGQCRSPAMVTVAVDINPGDFPNSINPRSNGVIPVAILSTTSFDATTVDPLNVQFGPQGAVLARGHGHLEDVNGDGKLDLLLRFKTRETGIRCGQTSASLTGETFTKQTIQGSDSIVTVGCQQSR